MPDNPYLPSRLDQLSQMLMSLGAGISQAGAAGQPWYAGIGPGAALYGAQMGRARQFAIDQQQQDEMMGLRRQALADKEAETQRRAGMGQAIANLLTPGMKAPVSPDTMGPGDAIAQLESGGRYDAVGPVANPQGDRAYGKYQVMGANVGPWTQEVLGTTMTPQQFLASPQAQEAVFKAKFGQYAQQYGEEGARRAWFAGPGGMNNPKARDVNGVSVAQYSQRTAPQVAQGDSVLGPGVTNGPPATGIAQLDPTVRAAIGAVAAQDPDKAAQMLITALQNVKREDSYSPLSEAESRMYLGQAYDPTKSFQRNKVTGEIKPIGGSLVNINNQQESTVTKQLAEQDAKRVGDIQANEDRVRDLANKVRMATDMLSQTYTGPAGEYANTLFKALGSMGVEQAKNAANAGTAASAIISQMMPFMRAPGSGATSDFEMRTFAQSLPGLANLPGGNELIAQYFERIAERASQVRGIAERTITEKKGLTGTGYADEIKKLGPLFSKEELDQMQALAKSAPKTSLDSEIEKRGLNKGNMTPAPSGSALDQELKRRGLQ